MSKIEVDTIAPQSGTTVTLGEAGDTVTVPTGVTLDTSNSTVTLPDGSVTNAKIADSTIQLAKLSATGTKDATTFLRGDNTFAEAGGGIEMADTWRVTSNFSGTVVITANWERDDTYSPGFIGTGMTESSGIFTFPSTGIYQINFGTRFFRDTATQFVIGKIEVTTDNSTYNEAGTSISNVPVANYYNAVYFSYIFDVTSTSTHKVRFATQTNDLPVNFTGSTSSNHTYAQFVRLGDT